MKPGFRKPFSFSIQKKVFDIHKLKAQGVRIVHRASGAVGESRDTRSPAQNKKIALRRLTQSDKFREWLKVRAAAVIRGVAAIEDGIDGALQPPYVEVPYRKTSSLAS